MAEQGEAQAVLLDLAVRGEVYTPKGIRIPLGTPYAFALMARLHPAVTPTQVLRTVDGILALPDCATFIAGMLCFALHAGAVATFMTVLIAHVMLRFMTECCGFPAIPFPVCVARVFSRLHGWGIYSAVLVLAGWWRVGWWGIGAYFAGKVCGGIVALIACYVYGRARYLRTHRLLHPAMYVFHNALLLHAFTEDGRRIPVLDSQVLSSELTDGGWKMVFAEFAQECPTAASKCTSELVEYAYRGG